VHNDDVPLDEQFRALENLVQQGKIRYVGVSNYRAWQVCRAINIQDRINASQLITVQNPYSLMDRELEREMFPFCRASGVGVMAYSPLGVGLLSGAYRPGSPPPAGKLWTERGAASLQAALNGQPGDVLRVAFEIAGRLEVTVAQLAQQWVMTHPEVSVVVMGANTAEQVDDNLGAFDVELTADDLAALDQASRGLEIKGW